MALWNGSSDDEESSDAESEDLNLQRLIRRKEREIQQTQQRVEDHRTNYRRLIQKGSQTDSPLRRRVFAVKARMAKFKGNIGKMKQMKAMRDVSKLTLSQGQSEIMEMVEEMEETEAVDRAAGVDPDEFQERILDAQATIQTDLGEISTTMDQMDVDVGDMEMQQTEEEELMAELAARDAEVDDFDFDELEAMAGYDDIGAEQDREREF